MSGKTGIAWTDTTWNPTTGCTRVSPGCDHCYAFSLHDMRFAKNREASSGTYADGTKAPERDPRIARANGITLPFPRQYDRPFSTVQLIQERIEQPLHWQKPRRVFVDSMSDLFHEDVPDEYIDRVFATMALTQYVGRCRRRECDHEGFSCEGHLDPPVRHTYQILTKRPERMRAYVADPGRALAVARAAQGIWYFTPGALAPMEWPLPNVWLGVSAEDRERLDARVPILLDTPAAVRFISAEPLLGSLGDIDRYIGGDWFRAGRDNGVPYLDWVIVGGESGQHARPCDIGWIREIVEQCRAADVAVFVKQLGAKPAWPLQAAHGDDVRSIEEWIETGKVLGWKFEDRHGGTYRRDDAGLRVGHYIGLQHSHGADMAQWPEDLRIQEFPEPRS